MDTTDEVVPLDRTVGHERPTVHTATVEDAVSVTVRPTHHDKIYVLHDGVGESATLKVIKACDGNCSHNGSLTSILVGLAVAGDSDTGTAVRTPARRTTRAL